MSDYTTSLMNKNSSKTSSIARQNKIEFYFHSTKSSFFLRVVKNDLKKTKYSEDSKFCKITSRLRHVEAKTTSTVFLYIFVEVKVWKMTWDLRRLLQTTKNRIGYLNPFLAHPPNTLLQCIYILANT
jgi:hypothetical protein